MLHYIMPLKRIKKQSKGTHFVIYSLSFLIIIRVRARVRQLELGLGLR